MSCEKCEKVKLISSSPLLHIISNSPMIKAICFAIPPIAPGATIWVVVCMQEWILIIVWINVTISLFHFPTAYSSPRVVCELLSSIECTRDPLHGLLSIMNDLWESRAVDLYMLSSPVTYLTRGSTLQVNSKMFLGMIFLVYDRFFLS